MLHGLTDITAALHSRDVNGLTALQANERDKAIQRAAEREREREREREKEREREREPRASFSRER